MPIEKNLHFEKRFLGNKKKTKKNTSIVVPTVHKNILLTN